MSQSTERARAPRGPTGQGPTAQGPTGSSPTTGRTAGGFTPSTPPLHRAPVRLARLTLWALLLGLGLTAAPTDAAAKGVAIINTGEDFFEAGPMPELADHPDPKMKKLKAGYKCNVFGVFWAYLHWWDCEPVLYYEEADVFNYINTDEAKAMVSAKYSQKDMKMGFWAGNGRWIFAGVIGLFLLIGIISKVRSKS